MGNWIKVGVRGDIPPGEAIAVRCPAEMVAVFNVDGEFYAISNSCPHAGGALSEGFVEDGRVVCPWHGWSFPLSANGAPRDGVCRYAVRVQGEDIEVDAG